MPDSPYEGQMLVCVFGPWCRLDGGAETHKALKGLAKEAGIASRVRVTKSGCLGQCGHGPMVACWPENVWYAHVRPEDAKALFESHVVRGEPLERLRYHPEKPGTNKTPEVLEKEKAGSGAD